MQTLKFLGRGSAFNTKEGNTSAYYIDKENNLYLIDCGENIFEKIKDKGLLYNRRNIYVIITHLHSDHCGSLSSLIYYTHYILQKNIKVLYPNYKLFDLLEMIGHKGYEYDYNILFDKINVVDNILIEFKETSHIKDKLCYGYYMKLDNGKLIFYSGDTNKFVFNKKTPAYLKLYDEVYQDTCLADYEGNVHLSLKKLCELIPKEFRNKIYCMHIDNDELIDKAKNEGFNVVEIEN